MDNHENNQAPVGAEGATSSQDNAQVQVTQPVAPQAPVSAGVMGQGTGQAQPWEQDERFKGKTADDIWKAYQNAESLVGQASQKASLVNELEQVTGMSPDEIRNYLQAHQQQQLQQQIQQNPLAYVDSRVQDLENTIALQNQEKELDTFLQANPEYSEFRDKIFDIGTTIATDKPYDEIAKEWFGSAIAQGQNSAYQKIDTKQKQQATGTSTAPQNPGVGALGALPRAARIKAFEQMVQQG